MSAFFNLLIGRPRSSLAVALACISVIATGAARLKIDFSPEQVYVGEDDAVEFCEQHKELFRFEDSLVLVVLESTDERPILRGPCLRWMDKFADRAASLQGVRDVTSITTLERPRVRSDVTWTPLLLKDHFDDGEYIAGQLDRIPLLNDTLVSPDRMLAMTLIDLAPDQRRIKQARRRVRAIQSVIAEMPPPPGSTTFLSGVPAIRVDVIDSIVQDQKEMVPVCSALFFIVSLLMFRSLKVTLLSLCSSLSSVALTLGLMGYCGLTFSVMSNVIPVLLLIIGAANNVHILSRFQVQLAGSNIDPISCVRLTMAEMSRTCLLTLTTTAVGFGSLLIARADLLQSLAIQAALGMACCYVGLMTIMPPTLVLCSSILARGIRRENSADSTDAAIAVNTENGDLSSLWNRVGRLIAGNSVAIVVVHIGLAVWTLWACRDIAINSYMFETYDNSHPTMQSVHKLDEKMSGLISLEIQFQSKDRKRLFAADTLDALSQFRTTARQDDTVTFYRDYVEYLSVFDFGRSLDGDPVKAAASLRRVQLALRNLNRPEMTAVFLASDQPAARVMMRIKDVGSAGMNRLIGDLTEVLDETIPRDVTYRFTGDAYLHAVCMDAFTRDLFYSLIAASGVIFLLITTLFRSLRIGLISAIPNMFPLVMTLGYMHLRGYELTAGNVIVFAISLGIAVDDTIHFLARFRDESQRLPLEDSVQATLSTSGRAILLTSILVVSGLSILVFSDFVPTRRFAELTAITMCSALPGDVILLPAMLRLFAGRGRTQNGHDTSHHAGRTADETQTTR